MPKLLKQIPKCLKKRRAKGNGTGAGLVASQRLWSTHFCKVRDGYGSYEREKKRRTLGEEFAENADL